MTLKVMGLRIRQGVADRSMFDVLCQNSSRWLIRQVKVNGSALFYSWRAWWGFVIGQ